MQTSDDVNADPFQYLVNPSAEYHPAPLAANIPQLLCKNVASTQSKAFIPTDIVDPIP
mgnify:CR=1 FL=1